LDTTYVNLFSFFETELGSWVKKIVLSPNVSSHPSHSMVYRLAGRHPLHFTMYGITPRTKGRGGFPRRGRRGGRRGGGLGFPIYESPKKTTSDEPPFLAWTDKKLRDRRPRINERITWWRNLHEELTNAFKINNTYIENWLRHFMFVQEESNEKLSEKGKLTHRAKGARDAKLELVRHCESMAYLERVKSQERVYDLGFFVVNISSVEKFVWRFNSRNKVVESGTDRVLPYPPSGSDSDESVTNALTKYRNAISFFRKELKMNGETAHEIQTEFYVSLGLSEKDLNSPVMVDLDSYNEEEALRTLDGMVTAMFEIGRSDGADREAAKQDAVRYYDTNIVEKYSRLREEASTLRRYLTRGNNHVLPRMVMHDGQRHKVEVYPEDPLSLWKAYHELRVQMRRYEAMREYAQSALRRAGVRGFSRSM